MPELTWTMDSVRITGCMKSMSQAEIERGLPTELAGAMPALCVIAMPADTNRHGNIFGGWLMSHMDLASAQKAIEATGQDVVTRAASIDFVQPVHVGDRVSFFAVVEKVGTTSITIGLQAWALRWTSRSYEHVGGGRFVFVALDADKNKTRIALKP